MDRLFWVILSSLVWEHSKIQEAAWLDQWPIIVYYGSMGRLSISPPLFLLLISSFLGDIGCKSLTNQAAPIRRQWVLTNSKVHFPQVISDFNSKLSGLIASGVKVGPKIGHSGLTNQEEVCVDQLWGNLMAKSTRTFTANLKALGPWNKNLTKRGDNYWALYLSTHTVFRFAKLQNFVRPVCLLIGRTSLSNISA